MSCCAPSLSVEGAVDQSARSDKKLAEERLIAGSLELSNGNFKTDLIVPDMHCVACISTIERGLGELAPTVQVRANLSTRTVSIIWDPEQGSGLVFGPAMKALGFAYHLSDQAGRENHSGQKSRSLLLALAVAGFAAANIMLLSVSVWSGAEAETARLFHLISGLIAVPTVAFSGQPFFRSAMGALAAGRLNMDVPISLAVVLALGMSVYEGMNGGEEAYFDAAVSLLFFLLVGRYLDHLMREKARGAVDRLHSLSAKDGILVSGNGETSHIELKSIRAGMRLRVFPGERFPVNGRIVKGTSDLDRSHVTGESEPTTVGLNDFVEAGTLNLTGAVDIKALTSDQDSFLGEMKTMIAAAENGRSGYVRIADRMAQIYAPAVHLLALITFIGWMIASNGDWHTSIYTAIAVLIVTCPCALGLAVPVAHVIGANRLMQNGILMRDGTALERLADIDTVVFDKTGTLTSGAPLVTNATEMNETDMAVLRALASLSSHPVAKAVANFTGELEPVRISDIQEVPGFGIEGKFEGRTVRLGKGEWVSEITQQETGKIPEHASASFAIEGCRQAFFEISDEIRTGACQAIEALKNWSVECQILSGDTSVRVATLARQLGISCYLAGQSPKDKIDHIEVAQEKGNHVLMVGDGINDAPALVASHVSMVPASASDIGRQSADFVFVRQSLNAVPLAFDIARKTSRIVRQNFGLAIAYNCIAVPLAMFGYVTPLIAAIAMSASSILVVANSFRISLAGDRGKIATGNPDRSGFGFGLEFAK